MKIVRFIFLGFLVLACGPAVNEKTPYKAYSVMLGKDEVVIGAIKGFCIPKKTVLTHRGNLAPEKMFVEAIMARCQQNQKGEVMYISSPPIIALAITNKMSANITEGLEHISGRKYKEGAFVVLETQDELQLFISSDQYIYSAKILDRSYETNELRILQATLRHLRELNN